MTDTPKHKITLDKAIVNQTYIGTVSMATLGKFLRDAMDRIIIYGPFRAHIHHLELNGTFIRRSTTDADCQNTKPHRKRAIVRQTNTGTFSLGKLLRDGAEHTN